VSRRLSNLRSRAATAGGPKPANKLKSVLLAAKTVVPSLVA
jgi:hypothetical protein